MSHLDRSVQQQPPLNLAGQTCTRLPASFELIIRQQPVRSRMCGVGERVDRRPIDPPPIVQLKLEGQGSDETLQNISPYIFLVAVLVSANEEEEDQVSPPRIDFHSRLTIGRTVSSLYLLRDLNDSEGAFFVFSDISVRVDGHYRLRMCLFELVDSCVHYRRDILTDPFTVYSAKKFPGMHLSCRLARHFAQQGLKIRIRKESRKRGSGSRRHSREQDDDDDAAAAMIEWSLLQYRMIKKKSCFHLLHIMILKFWMKDDHFLPRQQILILIWFNNSNLCRAVAVLAVISIDVYPMLNLHPVEKCYV
ncbi:velvet factor-domain-containing protein [Phascolomyces articulosus]|uniref:Velvet factor-domain-containing protein n=1 Tax=Phascolomyces articulosus TaxID=60185 RepID=A0AAD5JXT0_9FUNG|nr:velvet factor-domain-containing protein [Phascolomyces articulosus]